MVDKIFVHNYVKKKAINGWFSFSRNITSIISDRFSVNKVFFFFFYSLFYYHFSKFILAVIGLCCCAWALSSCGQQGLLCIAEWASYWGGFLLWSTGSRTRAPVVASRGLYSVGLVFVAHGVSCSRASGIFLDHGSNPCFLHLQVDYYPLYQ